MVGRTFVALDPTDYGMRSNRTDKDMRVWYSNRIALKHNPAHVPD